MSGSIPESQHDLLAAFHDHYQRYEQAVQAALSNPTDSTVLERLGDDLDQFSQLVAEVSRQYDRFSEWYPCHGYSTPRFLMQKISPCCNQT